MALKLPVIVLNVKSYRESMGEKGLALARICESVAEETGVSIAIAPQQVDLAWIARQVKISCLAQHADALEAGSRTGYVVLEAVKAAGAVGTLLNHSEHPMDIADVDAAVQQAKQLGLITIVCAKDTDASTALAKLRPYSIAVEPPALIGSGIAVSKADPKIVSESVEVVKKIYKDIAVLCGAGITTGEDVRAAIELGAEGVLLASGVVKAKDPRAALLDLAGGIR
ncbi:MAG: triose-phosphate isomerase [Euryarchaeota archaeon]|nr:triose-phosphate isomerase [Euryarchaeota archaeon]